MKNDLIKLNLLVYLIVAFLSPYFARSKSIEAAISDPIVLFGHNGSVFALKQLKNGNLASGSSDLTVRLWNLTNLSSPVYAILKGHTDVITSLSVLPNDELASASCDMTIKIWNTMEASLKYTLQGHKECVIDIATLLDDNLLASAGFDDTIKIWNTNSGSLVRTLYGHLNYVETLAVLNNGYLASGSQDMRIKIWNVNAPFPIKTIPTHQFLRKLFVLNNGDLVSAYDIGGPVQVWDAMEGKVKLSINVSNFDLVYSFAQLPNESGDLVGGCLDTSIKIWDLKTAELKRTLNGHNSTVFTVIMLKDGRLASSSADRTIRIWNV
jgi:WD40 repeat protein